MRAKRIVVCGGPYSDNLGDVLIHECLKGTLGRVLPGVELESLDIGGRREVGDVAVRSKSLVLRLIRGLPAPVRRLALFAPLQLTIRRRILPVWKQLLRPEDDLVIGGGQLLQDPDLNFPLKLLHLARQNDRLRGRRSIFAVGVGREWSRLGTRCFRELIASEALRYLSVRDERSRDALVGLLPELSRSDVHLDPDPALLVEEVYAPDVVSKDLDVGVCPASPHVIGAGEHSLSDGEMLAKWIGLVKGLCSKGQTVGLFTNGTEEDEEFLSLIAARCGQLDGVTVLPRALRGGEYIARLVRMKSVVAHRLHAAISCYALGIPSLGLRWDEKLSSFFDLTERSEFTENFTATPLAELVEKVAGLSAASIDPTRRTELIETARAGVERLGQSLMEDRR